MIGRSLFLALATVLGVSTALGQTPFSGNLLIVNRTSTSCPSTYVGPGDLVSGAAMFWGVKAYSNAFAATQGSVFDLRRVSDNATTTVTMQCSGSLDTVAIAAWIGASSAVVTKAYDQTGHGRHLTQVTAALQPTLNLSGGPGGSPYISITGNNGGLAAGLGFSASTGLMGVVAVVDLDTAAFSNPVYTTSGSQSLFHGSNAGGNGGKLFMQSSAGTSFSASAAAAAWHDVQGRIKSGSALSGLNVDGSLTTGTLGASTTSGVPRWLNSLGTQVSMSSEAGWWDNVELLNADLTALHGNARSRYGF